MKCIFICFQGSGDCGKNYYDIALALSGILPVGTLVQQLRHGGALAVSPRVHVSLNGVTLI